MTYRELFKNVCKGNRPDQVLFAPDITDWYLGQHRKLGEPLKFGPGVYIPDDDPIKFEHGIGIPESFYGMSLMEIHQKYEWSLHAHIRNWYEEYYTDAVQFEEQVDGPLKMIRYKTKKGTLERTYKLAADGSWCSINYLLDAPNQIEILFEVINATRFRLVDEKICQVMKAIGEQGHSDIVINRSPFGKMLHEYLGFENTTYFMHDDIEAYRTYEQIQTLKDLELIDLAGNSSCPLIIIVDHADSTLFSPEWYEKYCIPFYQEAGLRLRKTSKLISTHVDGNLKSLLPLLKDTGFDLLDGCTPAPMFNYSLEELALSLGENMSAFVGVPSSMFCDGSTIEEVCSYADKIINAFQGRAILNVGDILPVNGSIEKVIALGSHVHAYNKRIGKL